jgi:hypothetical protein
VDELRASDSQRSDDAASRPWIISNLVEIVRITVHPDTRDLSNANRALETFAKIGR